MNHYHRPEMELDPAKLPGQIVNRPPEHLYVRDIVAAVQREEPVLEDRYIVLKRSDVARLGDIDYGDLWALIGLVRNRRRAAGKPALETVVVEQDWPEYEPTVQALLARSA